MCCDRFCQVWLLDGSVSLVMNCLKSRSSQRRSDPTILIIRVTIEGGNGRHGSMGKCVRRPAANMVLIVGMDAPVIVSGGGVFGEAAEQSGDDDVAVGRAITDMRVTSPIGPDDGLFCFIGRIQQTAVDVEPQLIG